MQTNRDRLTNAQQERLAKWIAALRSGKYAQAQETLRTADGFCCLGVYANECLPVPHWQDHGGDNAHRYTLYTDEDTAHGATIHDQVWQELGFPFGQANLAELNDAGASFNDIADLLEAWASSSERLITETKAYAELYRLVLTKDDEGWYPDDE